MASRNCPVCGATVKLENLERHVANVHPREEPSVVLSEEERRAVRRDARRAKPAFHVRRSTLTALVVVSISIVGVAFGLPYLPAPGPPAEHAGDIVMHWHPQLTIMIDGQLVTIPANIGIDPALWQDHSLDPYGMQAMPQMGMGAMAPLHTHDTSGTIHEESRELRDYTLGDFFRIWGQSVDAQQALGHAAGPGHQVWMVVDGNPVSPSDSQVLRDGMQIEVVCGIPG